MTFKTLSALAAASVLCLAPLSGQDSKEEQAPAGGMAAEVLGRIQSLFDKPFQCDFALDMDFDEDRGAGKGRLRYASSKLFALDLDLDMQQHEGEKKFALRLLADGEFLFVDMQENGESQQMMPLKVSVDLLGQLTSGSGAGMGVPDLVQLPQALSGIYSMTHEGGEDSRRYVMEAREADVDGPDRVLLEFHSKHWLPKLVHATGKDGESIKLATSNLSFPESPDPANFKFVPKEGQTVTDMTGMLEAQLEQAGAISAEEEF